LKTLLEEKIEIVELGKFQPCPLMLLENTIGEKDAHA
jgi:hypothetical protein